MSNNSNHGSHAYLVRHASIKNKVMPIIKFMTHEIDKQLEVNFDRLNAYIVHPSIIMLSSMSTSSSIEEN